MVIDMSPKATKQLQIQPKRRGLYTPEPVRVRVVARHIEGESNREIARNEAIDRETVGRILSQQEVVHKIAEGHSRLLALVPKAIGVCEEALNSDDLRLATATATKILEGVQVMGGIEQIFEFAKKASPEAEQKQRRLLVLAEMMDTMMAQDREFPRSLDSDLKNMEEEVKRRMEQPGSNGVARQPPRV
jgi:hypothetical protein